MDSLSLMAFTVANLGKGCRDFVRRKNRGILKICGEEKAGSIDNIGASRYLAYGRLL